MSQNIDIIKELYKHFAAGNGAGIAAIFARDIEWVQMKGFPGGGHFIGFENIANNVFKGFGKYWTDWKASVDEFVEAGADVFVIGKYSGTYNETGKYMEAEFVHRYTLSDGKVEKFKQYTDTKQVADAVSS